MSLLVSRTGATMRLTINRLDQENRLDPDTLLAIERELIQVREDPDPVSVIILDAAGPDFSLGRQRDPDALTNPKAIVAEFSLIQRVNEALMNCQAVTIAALQGRAEGAGLSLAARCDIVVAAENAQLSFPEIPHGIPPTIVLSHYRYVLPQHVLGDLIFTGRVVTGGEAVTYGLAARHVPDEELKPAVDALAAEIASHDRDSMRMVKRFLNLTRDMPPVTAPETGIAMYAVEMADRSLTQKHAN